MAREIKEDEMVVSFNPPDFGGDIVSEILDICDRTDRSILHSRDKLKPGDPSRDSTVDPPTRMIFLTHAFLDVCQLM